MPGRVNPTYGTSLLAPQQGTAMPNPLSMIGELANVQNAMNRNMEFQRDWQSRIRFGEITQGPGSLEDRMNQALQDPLTAANAMPQLAALRQSQLAIVQMQKEQMEMGRIGLQMGGLQAEQAQSGWGVTGKLMMRLLNNPDAGPDMYDDTVKTASFLMSPAAREQARPALDNWKHAIYDRLPSDPTEAMAERDKRIGAMISTLVPPDQIRGYTGMPAPEVKIGPTGPYVTGGPAYQAPFAPAAAGAPPAQGPTPTPPGTAGALAPGQGIVHTIGGGPLPSEAQKSMIETFMPKAATLQEDIGKTTSQLPMMAEQMDNIQDALRHFTAGGSSSSRAAAARAIQGLGNWLHMDPELIRGWVQGINNGSLSARDIFNAQIRVDAVQQLKAAAQGTGRVMLPEVTAFMDMLSEDISPTALEHLINTTGRFILRKGFDVMHKWNQYMASDPNAWQNPMYVANFQNWYGEQYHRDKLPTTTPGGQFIGPRDPMEAMGAPGDQPPPEAVTTRQPQRSTVTPKYKWNPSAGKLEPQ